MVMGMEVTVVWTFYISFAEWDCQPHAQPQSWRTRVSRFVWVITFDLSGTWCHTSSITTASIALRIIWPHKPHHYVKVGIPSVGCNNYKNVSIVTNIQNKTLHFRNIFRWSCTPEEGTNANICVSVAYITDTNLLLDLSVFLTNCCTRDNIKMHGTTVKIIITIFQPKVTKLFLLSQIFKTKHCISKGSSGKTAHLKKLPMQNICVS